MKKLITIILSVSLLAGTASYVLAQGKQDPPKEDGKGKGDKGKDAEKGKDGMSK